MSKTLGHLLAAIRQMLHAADIDHVLLSQAKMDEIWFADYAHQRVVNSFLFNYINIQDKLGSKLFRLALQHWRELENDSMTMMDILNRLEKLRIIDSVDTWDRLREIRNAITHEYPDDMDLRIENIHLAMSGYLQMKAIIANLEKALLAKC